MSLDDHKVSSLSKGKIVRFVVSGEAIDVEMEILDKWPKSAWSAAAHFAESNEKINSDGTIPVTFSKSARNFNIIKAFMMSGELIIPQHDVDCALLYADALEYCFTDVARMLLTYSPKLAAPITDGFDPKSIVPTAGDSKGDTKDIGETKGEETKGETKLGSEVKSQLTYWTPGDVSNITDDDQDIRQEELPARITFGRDEDGTDKIKVVKLFEEKFEAVPPPGYQMLSWPGMKVESSDIRRFVPTLKDFQTQFQALTLGVLDDVLGKLPFVVAGGAVLASLHNLPRSAQNSYPPEIRENIYRWFFKQCSELQHGPARRRWRRAYDDEVDDLKKKVNDLTKELQKGKASEIKQLTQHRDTYELMCWIYGIEWTGEEHKRVGAHASDEEKAEDIADDADETETDVDEAKTDDTKEDDAKADSDDAKADSGETDVDDAKADSDDAKAGDAKADLGDAKVDSKDAKADSKDAKNTLMIDREPLRSFMRTDIDLFLTTRNPTKAQEAIAALYRHLRRIVPKGKEIHIMRTDGAVTFLMPWPYRTIQVINRLYYSATHVLIGFDLDCCCVAYDGSVVTALPRAVRALQSRYNLVDATRQSTSYESRLLKYARRGFSIAVPGLDVQTCLDVALRKYRA